MFKAAVLVSGGGTNLQSLIDYQKSHADCPYKICVVISSTKNAYALERARTAGIDCVVKSPFSVMGKEAAQKGGKRSAHQAAAGTSKTENDAAQPDL